MFASQRSGSEFNKFWPDKTKELKDIIVDKEMQEAILRIHKVKV